MATPDHSAFPDLATWPVFCTIVALLVGALAIDIALAAHWSDPFAEAGTWVLMGVVVGVGLRALGAWRSRQGLGGDDRLRRLSLAVWGATALGGLVSLLF
ncbi:MAG: hypothetical protein ABEK75_08425 [Salinibacter sp.]